jgi:hypothetical protein
MTFRRLADEADGRADITDNLVGFTTKVEDHPLGTVATALPQRRKRIQHEQIDEEIRDSHGDLPHQRG